MLLHVNLRPDLAREVEEVARRLRLSKAKLIELLIRRELQRVDSDEGIFRILSEVVRGRTEG